MKRSPGFALMELLLSLALLALGMVLVTGSVRAVVKLKAQASLSIDHMEQLQSAQRFMRTRIASAQAIGFAAGNEGQVVFDGQAQRMTLMMDQPAYVRDGGPHILMIEAVSGSGDVDLRACIAKLGSGPPVRCEPGLQTLLASSLKHVAFEYRGHDLQGQDTQWQPHWRWKDRLPMAVRISAQGEDGKWEPQVVAVEVAQ